MSDDARAIFDDQVLPRFETRHGGWITHARACARAIVAEKGQATIDEVRELCPPPDGADPRIMGTVFQKGEFVRVGFAVSARRSCHGRMIGVFRLRVSARAGKENA
jgi:hypothetical protein